MLTKKQVIRIRTIASNLEYLYQIKELAVNVSYNRDGRLDMYHIALLHQQLLCFRTYRLDHRLGEELFSVKS